MKAMVYNSYGPPEVFRMENVEKPEAGDNDVLIKVIATTVSAGDWRMRKADPFLARIFNGFMRPKKINILGFEFSGVIETVGNQVTKFKKGDAVFAYSGLGFGAYADYKCLPEMGDSKRGLVTLKPTNFTFQEAAAVPLGSLTALAFLRDKGRIAKGQSVLIYGASGSVGSYAVQIAKHFGAEVTGVCSSANLNMVKELGADQVLDYTSDKFYQLSQSYDLVFDAVGKCPRSTSKKLLKKSGKRIHTYQSVKFNADDLDFIRELCQCGKIKPYIDKIYEFEHIPDAHRYVESFHKKGNVVIRVSDELEI